MVISIDRLNKLITEVVKQIQADSDFQPDTILALSTGGFPVAAALAKRLNIKSRVLLAREDGLRADYYAETCSGQPPKFYWEEF